MNTAAQSRVHAIRARGPGEDGRERFVLDVSIAPDPRWMEADDCWWPERLTVGTRGDVEAEADTCRVEAAAVVAAHGIQPVGGVALQGPARLRIRLSAAPDAKVLAFRYGTDRFGALVLPETTRRLTPESVPAVAPAPAPATSFARVTPIAGLDAEALRGRSRQEVPERFASTPEDARAAPELLDRLEEGEIVYRVQVTVPVSADLQYLANALTTAASLCREVDGVIRDVLTGTLLDYAAARRILKSPAFRLADHVLLRVRAEDGLRLETRGMPKFGRPDIGLRRVAPSHEPVAREALMAVATYLSGGVAVAPGETLELGAGLLRFEPDPTAVNDTDCPNGVLLLDDYDPDRGVSEPGIARWLAAVSA